MKNYRRYPEYKDSGIEWLGQIPSNWEVKPLKHVANFVNGLAFSPSEWGLEGTPIIRIGNLNGGQEFNYTEREVPAAFHAYKGDLLFGWSGNRGTSFGPFLWWREGRHFVNQHIFKLSDYSSDKTWLYWALRAATYYVEQLAHGIIGMVHITRAELGAIPVPDIPIAEQQAIADFLDRETAKIDALIEKKERLIELLKEKRTALITHAVTKGLDPHVPMKDSGIEWLGQIPAHWAVLHLRRVIARIEQGWSPVAEDRIAGEDEWGVVKLSAIQRGKYMQEEHKALPSGVTPKEEHEIKVEDILLTRGNTPQLVGDVCLVHETRSRLMFSDLVYRLVMIDGATEGRYIVYWLLSRAGRIQIETDARGSSLSMVKLSQGNIKDWYVAMPPPSEQRNIADFLDRETAKIDAMIAKIEEAIKLLKEYRTALISAAVTGKIDVRNTLSEPS